MIWVSLRLRRLRKSEQIVIDTFLSSPIDRRADALRALLDTTDCRAPGWYLLGCLHLRSCRVKEAARAFGMAHHSDYRLETAALLTFACLKAKEGEGSDIIEQILVTWQEMKRPDVVHRAEDRRMLDCLASTTRDVPTTSQLGRLIWLVTGPAHQSKIEEMLAVNGPNSGLLKQGG